MTLFGVLIAVGALAALTPLLARVLGRHTGHLGAAVLAACAVVVAAQLPSVRGSGPVTAEIAWLDTPPLALALRLDTLAWLFAMMVLVIGAVVLTYTARYLSPGSRSAGRLPALLAAFAAAMLGLVLADDVVALFVFWELTSVVSYFLIAGDGTGRRAALRALVITVAGGLALLGGAVLLTVATGTPSISAMASPGPADGSGRILTAAAVLIAFAAFTKSAQWPLHVWLPGAMVAPTPVSTYLHAATMVKAGIYLLLRFSGVFADTAGWQEMLLVAGGITAVFGATVAIAAHDLKRLLAYSTVSQLGLITATIGLGTPRALAAATLHTLAHALFKATLFMAAGVVERATGTRDLRELSGLRRTLPLTATATALGAASMAGLPPLAGFVSKEEVLAAVYAAPTSTAVVTAGVLLVTASIGTVVYSARLVLGPFTGPPVASGTREPRGMAVPALLTGAAGLVAGALAGRTAGLLDAAAVDVTGVPAGVSPGLWHGVGAPLLTTVAVVAAGAAVLLVARRRQRNGHTGPHRGRRAPRHRSGLPDGAEVFDRALAALDRSGAVVARPTDRSAPAAFLLPVLLAALVAGTLAGSRMSPDGVPAGSAGADWVVVVLLAAAVVGVVQAASRLAAVAMLGLAGFLVAGWFVLTGGPDLALTQLLVETLTVTLVVIVFRHLPDTFTRGSAARKVAAAGVAVTIGTATGVATWRVTGRRELSEVGRRYLEDGEALSGGSNVVNTVLVDFRALDTLGEVAVLAVAALGILALVRLARDDALLPPEPTTPADAEEGVARWAGPGPLDTVVLRAAATVLAPVMVAGSVWLLLRGHDAVGGGFIGGLTGGAAVVLVYLSQGHERIWQSRMLRLAGLLAAGLAIAVGYALAGLVTTGALLSGGKIQLPVVGEVAASLVFDVGVYLVVVAMVVAILRHLGQGVPEDAPAPRPTAGDRGVR